MGETIDENGNPFGQNNDLSLTKSRHYVLGYDHSFGKSWYFKTEMYWQDLYEVPVISELEELHWFSTININEGYVRYPLVNMGTGTNYGVELEVEKKMYNGGYFLANLALFDSKYVAYDGVERNTRYSGRYSLNVLGGREWSVWNNNRQNLVGIGYKVSMAGNERQRGRRVENLYTESLPTYFRLDIQFSIRTSKKSHTSEWRFDIQNLTNRQNTINSANGAYQEKTFGLLPVLSYKLEF